MTPVSSRSRTIWIALVAVLATLSAVWIINLPPEIIKATMDDVRVEAEKGGYRLVDIGTLADLYETRRDRILIIDTRQEWEYRSGHIAGAVVFPMEPTWWARWRKKGPLKSLLGPDKQKLIVFY